jgi:hypothetical protein
MGAALFNLFGNAERYRSLILHSLIPKLASTALANRSGSRSGMVQANSMKFSKRGVESVAEQFGADVVKSGADAHGAPLLARIVIKLEVYVRKPCDSLGKNLKKISRNRPLRPGAHSLRASEQTKHRA